MGQLRTRAGKTARRRIGEEKQRIGGLESWRTGEKIIRRYPAEWEKQACVWLAWPHNEKEWGKGKLEKLREFYKKLISTILQFQDVNLILADEVMLKEVETIHKLSLQRTKQQLKKIIIPNNDIWIRDYGPFFVVRVHHGAPLLLDFEFNAWGGKFPPWDLDNNVSKQITLYTGNYSESYPVVLEGGAIDFNGNSIAVTTEECLLNKNRNPKITKLQMENIIKSVFNLEKIIWLKRGLKGDHTDGHVDNVARFIDTKKILINKPIVKEDNYLLEIKNGLKNYDVHIEEVPLPVIKQNRKRLPASYLNFIFVNGGIIVPTFDCETDKMTINIFKKLFPKRKIIGIDCSLLIQEGGGLHCMTKQEAAI